MSKISLGIIGGGQLGSLLCAAAKNININTLKKLIIEQFVEFQKINKKVFKINKNMGGIRTLHYLRLG